MSEVPVVQAADAAAPPDEGSMPLCPGCGYALVGLPPRGVCPECGQEYADDVIVLHGYARGSHADASTARPRSLVWFGLLALLQVLVFAPQLGRYAWVAGLLIVGIFGMDLWARGHSSHPGTVQVRFNRLGCVQHRNRVDPTVTLVIQLFVAAVMLAWLAHSFRQLDSPGGFVVFLGLAAIVWPIAYVTHRRRRAAAAERGLLAGLTDDLHRAVPTSWAETGEIVAERTGPGQYRLQVEAPRGVLRIPAVDIEIEGTDGQVGPLVRRLREWQSQGQYGR